MKKINFLKSVIILLLLCTALEYSAAQVSQIVYNASISTQTFTVPSGYSETITVYAWGAGGAGGATSYYGAGGGGGGAYSQKSFTLTPGNYTIWVGIGGSLSGTEYSASWFIDKNTFVANGGSNGSGENGGAGGAASQGYTSYHGGNGGSSVTITWSGGGGGGGSGGSAAPGGNGGNGSGDNLGMYGGKGGNAGLDYFNKSGGGGAGGSDVVFGSENSKGVTGYAVGGGGGGFCTTGSVSGNGANGLVIIEVEDVTVLPVLFTQFNVVCRNAGTAVLTWTTAQEHNSEFFEIQRSEDGIHFSTIAKMPAAGNRSNKKNYSFTDNDPQGNVFYRIAETDKDGVRTFTQVIHLECGNSGNNFSVYPNPVAEKIELSIQSIKAATIKIRIIDASGKQIYSGEIKVLPGNTIKATNLHSLAKGIYTIIAEWNNNEFMKTQKIVKL